MSKCTICGKEYTNNKNNTKKFCSTKCRKEYSRKCDKENVTDESSVTEDKYAKWNRYPNMKANLIERDKCMSFLETHSLKKCQEAGVWIPNWKRNVELEIGRKLREGVGLKSDN